MVRKEPDKVQELFINSEKKAANFKTKSAMQTIA